MHRICLGTDLNCYRHYRVRPGFYCIAAKHEAAVTREGRRFVCQLWLSVPGRGGLWHKIIPLLDTECSPTPQAKEKRSDRQIKFDDGVQITYYGGKDMITVRIRSVCVNAPVVGVLGLD